MKRILSVVPQREIREIKEYLRSHDIPGNTIIATPDGFGAFTAFWRITSRCNIFCRYCKNDSRYNSNELALLERLTILKKISEMTDELDFSGGELTTVLGYELLVKTAHHLGVKTSIVTNGVLVNKLFRTSDFIDRLFISLDYPPDYHNLNRPPTTYDQIYRNIQLLSRRHPHTTVESVVSSENYSDHFSDPDKNPFAEELLRDSKIEGIRYSFLMNKGRAREFYDTSKVPDAKIREAAELCKRYSEKYGIDFSAYDGSKPLDPRLHLNPFGEMHFFGDYLGSIMGETSDSVLKKVSYLLEQLYFVDARTIKLPAVQTL